MKKWLALILSALMLLSVVACGKPAEEKSGKEEPKTNQEEKKEETKEEKKDDKKEETKEEGKEEKQDEKKDEEKKDDKAAAGDKIVKDNLVVALFAEPQTMDPYAASHDVTFISSRAVFESLLKNENGTFVPWLAKEYKMIDDKTIEFKLRDDVYFHDGNKMTADDVVFSLGIAAKSNFTANMFGAIDTENTKAEDEHTVLVKLKYPYAPLLEALASHRGVILSKKSYEEMGAEKFGRAPVGTGPMKFKQWVKGDRIELEGFDKYWGEKPAFKNMTIRIILEASSRSIELETGGVDIAFQIAPVDWDRLRENPDVKLLTGNSMGMVYLCFNNSMEPYNNEDVRKAIAYAINVEAVAKTAYQGQADPADSFMAKSIPGYKKEGPWEYNPEKSKELLKKAGFEKGLTVKFITFQQVYYNACIEIIQSMLKEVGIESSIEMVDLATFTTMNNKGELPMTVMANYASINDPASALVAWPLSRTISLRHNDQHVQDLLDQGERTYKMEDRIKIYHELQDYLWSKLYLLPLAYPITGYGCRSNIGNFEFVPTGIPDFSVITFTK